MQVNCWCLVSPQYSPFMSFRPRFTLNGKGAVTVSQGRRRISICVDRALSEQVLEGSVVQADLVDLNAGTDKQPFYKFLPVLSGCDASLVMIRTKEGVQFAKEPKPHFQTSTIWLGAEGQGLMVDFFPHQSALKKQIFRLRPGESILFFDAHKEVTKITAGEFGNKPSCTRATNSEVADHILWVAKSRGRVNKKTLGWCCHALDELGCQPQLEEFYFLFPGFKAKVRM